MKRIRNAGFSTGEGYEDGTVESDDWEMDNQVEEQTREEREEEQDDDEDDAQLLQTFMNQMDHHQKQIMFGLLHKSLRDNYKKAGITFKRPSSSSKSSSNKKTSHAHAKATQDTFNAFSNSPDSSSIPEIADVLQELVDDMETTELPAQEILDRLPEQLARDFHTRLSNHHSTRQLVHIWQPWWISDRSTQHHQTQQDSFETSSVPPPLPKEHDLLVPVVIPRKQAVKAVAYSVVEVLVAYCYVMRMWNGDWRGQGMQVVQKLCGTSAVLAADARYGSVEEACEGGVRAILKEDGRKQVGVGVVSDVMEIMSGGADWVARALFECQRIVQLEGKGGGKQRKRRLRKIGFFVAWVLGEDWMTFDDAKKQIGKWLEKVEGSEESAVARRVVEMIKIRNV